MTTRLECSGITAGYGGPNIISNVSVKFEAGVVSSIIGPNGAGKSTLLKAIYGIAQVKDGSISIDGTKYETMQTAQMARLGVGYVPQLSHVFPRLSVQENLEIGSYCRRGEPSRINFVLEIFPPLLATLRRPAGQLSGGQQTMVAIGRALMSSPGILLLDEPTAGLAPAMAFSLWRSLRDLAANGVGIGVVEQNVRLALDNSEEVYLLVDGKNKLHAAGSNLSEQEDWESLFLSS
jgi:branched-chain amino acid transport system ATP-binding protein